MTRVLPLVVLFLAHLGAADDDYQFWDACAAGDDVVVRELLDAGVVDVEYPSEDGRSPLLIAVTEGHTAVARARAGTYSTHACTCTRARPQTYS